jgi:HAE1 family hydrophobic/amphiphilic exporter-1
VSTLRGAIVVPQASIVQGARGRVVFVVEAGSKAGVRPVEVVYAAGADAVVTGVQVGDRVGRRRAAEPAPRRAGDRACGRGGQRARAAAPPARRRSRCRRGRSAMNLSELFIRRPVTTVLLNAAIVLAGVIAYSRIPVAALPSYDTPVINVQAALPGASPETMATSVALPLERQFATIPGLSVISSTNTLGNTSLTLEFDEGRDIDAASVDVQAALLRAQRSLPQDMTQPPSYRKVNPADAPVLLLALTSPSLNLSDLNDFAEHLISPTLSTLDGVAQVNVFGRSASRCACACCPKHWPRATFSLDELTAALRAANANTPVGTLEGPRQTLTLQANSSCATRRVRRADRQQPQTATRCGCATSPRSKTASRPSRPRPSSTARARSRLRCLRQPDANTVKVVDAVRAAIPSFQASCRHR